MRRERLQHIVGAIVGRSGYLRDAHPIQVPPSHPQLEKALEAVRGRQRAADSVDKAIGGKFDAILQFYGVSDNVAKALADLFRDRLDPICPAKRYIRGTCVQHNKCFKSRCFRVLMISSSGNGPM